MEHHTSFAGSHFLQLSTWEVNQELDPWCSKRISQLSNTGTQGPVSAKWSCRPSADLQSQNPEPTFKFEKQCSGKRFWMTAEQENGLLLEGQDGPAGKSVCGQAWRPMCNVHGRRREPTSSRCPLSSIHEFSLSLFLRSLLPHLSLKNKLNKHKNKTT